MTAHKKIHLRHELKYPIDFMQYQLLRKKLSLVLKPDPHTGPDGCYHIRSLYFDDFKNSAFFDKQAGVARRKKYRIRIYNYSDKLIKFECKAKYNQYVNKECAKLSREEADKIVAGDVSFLANSENSLLREFYLECRHKLLRPVVIVDYLREAYIHPVGNVRITFDMGLHTNLGPISLFEHNTSTIRVDEHQFIILEVKFDDVLPLHIRGLFPTNIRPQAALGKFSACRESTNALTGCSITRF
ncbi:MAG: polyphosphate polymerase domain-containing protein [Candidatus Bathyarchaeota archaeon]|nr:polyphosphate polymerase domain-containing protein [Candidatus Bathyarchaeum sp.]